MAANDRQEGGGHYKKMEIEVWDYIARNNIPYLEGNAIKYLSRWRDKGGLEDLRKARHYVDKLIELEEEQIQLNEQAAEFCEFDCDECDGFPDADDDTIEDRLAKLFAIIEGVRARAR